MMNQSCKSYFLRIVFLFSAILLFCVSAHAQNREPKRVALVMGNDAYQQVGRLQKAGNDAEAMARELRAAGFDVMLARDLNYRSMVRTVESFTRKISAGDQAVVFFAGHGVQIKAGSYLLPVDIDAGTESEVEKTAYGLDDLIQKLNEVRPVFTLVLVDACRDNPLKSNGRSIGATRGLQAVEPPKGQMVVYSASRGQQALDSLSNDDRNPNGVFTREFITRMRQPGVRIEDLVREVRDSVEKLARSVNHEQRPAIYNEARGNFYFVAPRPGQAVVTMSTPSVATPTVPAANAPSAALQSEEDSPAAASFKRSNLAKTSSPVDVAVVSRMLQLPAGEERKPNISGFEAVQAFVTNDPFFVSPTGNGEKLAYEYFTADANVRVAKTCTSRGNQATVTMDYGNGYHQFEAISLLGGLINLEKISSVRNYLGKKTVRIAGIESLRGQPFPLTEGKRFGLTYTTKVEDGIGKIFGSDTSYAKWNVECGLTKTRGKGIPDGAQQLVCLTTAQGEGVESIWSPIRRLYLDQTSGCLVDTQ